MSLKLDCRLLDKALTVAINVPPGCDWYCCHIECMMLLYSLGSMSGDNPDTRSERTISGPHQIANNLPVITLKYSVALFWPWLSHSTIMCIALRSSPALKGAFLSHSLKVRLHPPPALPDSRKRRHTPEGEKGVCR
jgi:hypothetical protein